MALQPKSETSADRKIQIASPCLGQEEWEALRAPIESGWLTQGPRVAEFEANFARRHGVQHAIATSSCTTALHLSLSALGIGVGDEVIVPAFTWVATSNVIVHCGATPVFVDVDPITYNIDPQRVAALITARTKAIIPVHLFGLCADMDTLRDAAGDVPLVEDAACAAGASYKGVSAGNLGAIGCFSFHPRKSITTGEGGMVTTNDAELAGRVNLMRNHGVSISEEQRHLGPKPYILPDVDVLGYNYRMSDLQGAVGVVQLSKLDRFIEERCRWADFYQREFADLDWLLTPTVPEGYVHAWQAYVCRIDEKLAPMPRNELMCALEESGISTRPGTHAVHMLGYYREHHDLQPDDFPIARDCDRLTMAIPLHNRMTKDDYEYVVQTIRQIV